MPRLTLLACCALPGCIAPTFWGGNGDDVVAIAAQNEARFAVDSVGIAGPPPEAGPPAPPGPALLVRARRTAGDWLYLVEHRLQDTIWFQLDLGDGAAPALAELLTKAPLGPIDGCTIAVEWTRSHDGYDFWEGRIAVRGTLSPSAGCREVDAATIAHLLAAGTAVRPSDLATPRLHDCIDLAEQIDWRILRPWIPDGTGTVVACVPPLADAGCGAITVDDVDLLVRVGAEPKQLHLRVPAARMPVLAAVRRDSDTLLDRFVFFRRCIARPTTARGDLSPICCGATLALTTRIEELRPRYSEIERWLLIPGAKVVDAVLWWIFEHLGIEWWWPTRPSAEPRRPR